jgi:hypothetical protein
MKQAVETVTVWPEITLARASLENQEKRTASLCLIGS